MSGRGARRARRPLPAPGSTPSGCRPWFGRTMQTFAKGSRSSRRSRTLVHSAPCWLRPRVGGDGRSPRPTGRLIGSIASRAWIQRRRDSWRAPAELAERWRCVGGARSQRRRAIRSVPTMPTLTPGSPSRGVAASGPVSDPWCRPAAAPTGGCSTGRRRRATRWAGARPRSGPVDPRTQPPSPRALSSALRWGGPVRVGSAKFLAGDKRPYRELKAWGRLSRWLLPMALPPTGIRWLVNRGGSRGEAEAGDGQEGGPSAHKLGRLRSRRDRHRGLEAAPRPADAPPTDALRRAAPGGRARCSAARA